MACFGYLPSIFPKEILENTDIDFIIMDEPEISFSELYDHLEHGKSIGNLRGIAHKENGNVFLNERRERIEDLNQLPFPDYSLIKINLYNEFLLNRPFAVIQTARGCPFGCNYCVRTFGTKVTYRSTENIINELKGLKDKFNIKTIRFIDDTFTANKERVKRICQYIIEDKINLKWTCLSRLDTLDNEITQLMKKAGCARVYIGVESGSQNILDFYHKGYKLASLKTQIKMLKNNGIDTVGFFIVGAPQEREEDFLESIDFARDSDFDYLMVSTLICYPGTPLFENLKDKINFNLFPYKNEFRDLNWKKKIISWEKEFYRRFYLRPRYISQKIKILIIKPDEFIKDIIALWQYIFSLTNNKKRNDFI